MDSCERTVTLVVNRGQQPRPATVTPSAKRAFVCGCTNCNPAGSGLGCSTVQNVVLCVFGGAESVAVEISLHMTGCHSLMVSNGQRCAVCCDVSLVSRCNQHSKVHVAARCDSLCQDRFCLNHIHAPFRGKSKTPLPLPFDFVLTYTQT